MQEKSYLGRSSDGFHRIAYTEWGASADRAVICVHGLTRNGRDFDPLAHSLEKDAKIFCPDMPGRGKSEFLSDPASYNYHQYLADMTALIARTGATQVDWVGTSMGGIIGMLLAAEKNSPIRRLVINDVGPFIPLLALKRIGAYVGEKPDFGDLKEVEQHMRRIYASFGNLSDEEWKHMAAHGVRSLPNGRLALAHDPAIADAFLRVDQDVNLWEFYDRIRCPVLLLRGGQSDILPPEVAQEMTRRGPKARLVEFPKIGHAPALMDPTQISVIMEFLRP